MVDVKRYEAVHLRYDDNNIRYGDGCEIEVVLASDYAALEAELTKLRAELERGSVPDGFRVMLPTSTILNEGDRWEIYAPCGSGGIVHEDDVTDWVVRKLLDALAAAPSAPKADDPVKQMLLEALEKVDSEHEILGRMKTCELRRGRGSFGIAVMGDELALDWQSHQKNLERLIGLRHAAIAAARKESKV